MVNYQYTYIIGDLIVLGLWLFLFLYRKDTRKEMITLSLIFGMAAIVSSYAYMQDWWKPLTIIETPIGIEDFLFGFAIGGISSVIYEHLSNKRIKIKRAKEQKRNLNFLFLISLSAAIFFFGFFLFKLNTFISTILAFIVPTLIIYAKRKDLIKDFILSGILTLFIAIVLYSILNLITPGFFDEFWLFQNIGRIIIFKIPLEEIVWFFLAGAFIGPLYEYWKEGKLINVKS